MLTAGTAAYGIYAEEPVDVRTALKDLATTAARVVAHSRRHRLHALPKAEFIAAYDEDRVRPAPIKPARYPRRLSLDAPVTAVEAAVYATEAFNIVEAATPNLAAQRMAWLIPDCELPGAERILNLGLSCSRSLAATQIKAYAPNLTPPLQLRYRAASTDLPSPTASPFGVERIASTLPATLWPEWSIRFGLPTNTYERWRPALASAALLVGTDLTAEAAAKQLDNGAERTVHHLLRYLQKGEHWPSWCAAIARLADYLRTSTVPIDYERRRHLDYRNLLPDSDWKTVAHRAGALPGSAVKAEVARRYLFRRMSGRPALSDVGGVCRAPQMQTRTLNFPLDLTSELQSALDEQASAFLACNGIIDEPLTWHPPLDLLEGLALPIPEFEHVDAVALRTAASTASARVPALAKTFGVTIDTVRYLLDRNPPEPNASGGLKVRRDVLRAARNKMLTKEVLRELYDVQHLGCAEIGEKFGISAKSVRRRAVQYGVALRPPGTHVEFEWLYQNYVVARRTQTELCVDLSISWPTLRKWLDRYNLPIHQAASPTRIHVSQREARRILHRTLSRPAGRKHLSNFARVTEFQSVSEAAEHMGINRSTLNWQIRYLANDCGGPLLERSTRNRPIATTELGSQVLAAHEALCSELRPG
ncbi:LysR family transcriptional regulator [Mycobacterium syngnathidarum]